MDAKLKTDWIAALRSGEYRQAREMMHDDSVGSYCCLGVLCIIGGASFGDYPDEDFEGETLGNVAAVGDRLVSDSNNELTQYGLRLFGLSDGLMADLMSMNDGNRIHEPAHPEHRRAHGFIEIADYIEANIPTDHSVSEPSS